jgi:hypothetical protein
LARNVLFSQGGNRGQFQLCKQEKKYVFQQIIPEHGSLGHWQLANKLGKI